MLVRLVAETEDDVLETLELVLAVGKLEAVVGEVLAERDRVIGGLTLTVSGHDEEDATILGDLIEVLEIVFLRVANEGCQAKLLLSLLRETDGVLLRSTSLRAVEDDDALFLGTRCMLARDAYVSR